MARRTGAQYCVHESADLTFVFTPLHDGDEIELGNTSVRVRHTPGHSPESVCLVGTDLPGHFSGSVCGTGLSGKPTSTLAFEKRWNSMLSLDRQRFIEALSDVPPKPAEMERVLAFNRGTAKAETSA